MRKTLYTTDLLYDPTSPQRCRRDWAVLLDDTGTIHASGPSVSLSGTGDDVRQVPLLTPGFANAHVHLTDAGRRDTVPGGDGLVAWVGRLLRSRREESEQGAPETLRRMAAGGTVTLGEVANDLSTLPAIVASGMRTRLICEMIGHPAGDAAAIIERYRETCSEVTSEQVALSPGIHAPYSVSLELIDRIVEEARRRGVPTFIHLAEDPAERELYRRGEGEWRGFLEELGVWDGSFHPPGVDPIPFFDRQGYLAPGFVAVHLSDATDQEIELLAARGAAAILSPSSNLHITGRLPRYGTIVRSGLRFALGTDGRGSNRSIDVLDEARRLAEAFPEEPLAPLLRGLISVGHDILGFPEVCRIEPGMTVPLLAHSKPAEEPTEEGIAGVLLSPDNRIERIV